jgi:Mn-dependent DtxR family transcriptional regulator
MQDKPRAIPKLSPAQRRALLNGKATATATTESLRRLGLIHAPRGVYYLTPEGVRVREALRNG